MAKKQLDNAAAEARRDYFREWRRKNSDKVKQYNSGVRLQIQLNEGKVSNCNIWRIPSCKKCQAINS